MTFTSFKIQSQQAFQKLPAIFFKVAVENML